MRLTDLSVRKLRAPEVGQKTYYDDVLSGFGVRVSQGGAKSFIVMFGPKRRLKTLGRFPDLKLADARIEAKRVLGSVAGTPDIATRSTVSFDKARDQFLEASARRNKTRTADEYHRLLHRHFAFAKPIGELTRNELMRVIAGLANTPSEQDHAFVALRTMMNWCVKQGLLGTSPVPAHSVRANARDRVLSADETKAVLQRTEAYPYPYGPIVRLLLLTGQRRGEIAALQWDWIDAEKQVITLPAAITKNHREHTFPYGSLVQDTLETLPHIDDRYVFPSRSTKGEIFSGWSKSKKAFDRTLEDMQPYVLHDLRRTFASTLASLGTPIHVTEKLLNHISGTLSGIAAVYNRHTYFDEMQEAVAIYDRHLGGLIKQN